MLLRKVFDNTPAYRGREYEKKSLNLIMKRIQGVIFCGVVQHLHIKLKVRGMKTVKGSQYGIGFVIHRGRF